MSIIDYEEAFKIGQKEYRSCAAHGIYPYLPPMDHFVDSEKTAKGENIGLVQIPVEFIVGTKTEGRTNSFARNFMPIMDNQSEFAAKWIRLSEAHLEEGIREPIKAYEYMNRYYVEEGNKRVSVLKFFGAVTIPGYVTRVMPHDDGSYDVGLYYEFLEFNKLSGINFIEFSRPGSFEKLCSIVVKDKDTLWSEEDRLKFTALYYRFKNAFEDAEYNTHEMTVADILLICIGIYGYDELYAMSSAKLTSALKKAREEVSLHKQEKSVEVRTDPEEEKKQTLIDRMITGKPKSIKAVFIHDKDPETSGWTYGHELGRNHAQEILPWLDSSSVFNAMDNNPYALIENEIENGNQVIFTTSPRLLPASLRAAVNHPEVLILNCSLNISHRYLCTYYARMYEAKFITGAIAGAMSGGSPVGYICDYPIYGQIAGINAFALGVQMVNPTCKVVLEWSSISSTTEAEKHLKDKGITIISSHDMNSLYGTKEPSIGLFMDTDNGHTDLAKPVWHWGNYYDELLRRIRSKMIQADFKETDKALNYYWGMSANVVQVNCSDAVPESTRKLAALLDSTIREGICNPFLLPIKTQDGTIIDNDDHSLSMENIINMDWLTENIEGRIPEYEELNEVGRSTVEQMGVSNIRESKGKK